MFENIIEQGAVSQLRDDILGGHQAPCMLFYGPGESGKGSAALELARVLSCTSDGAAWKCSCPSCERHRYLQNDDLLILGKKSFSAEINASCSVFLLNPHSQSGKHLFFRSLRKLQMRFSPVLMEDDPKFARLSPLLQSLDELLNEFLLTDTEKENAQVSEKLCKALVKNALSLDEEGISALVPVGHIRKASYWCRLAPNGKRKTLIIENAENMRDEARNSLLKLLEEPPAGVSIVLTAQRREAVMPTILSRLRPYRFLKRSMEGEKEVLRRVFQYNVKEIPLDEGRSLISSYLESFLVQGTEKLYPLAVLFVASMARITSLSLKKKNSGGILRIMGELEERYAPIAEGMGFVCLEKSSVLIKTMLAKSGNFEDDSFSRFLRLCLELIAAVTIGNDDPFSVAFNDIVKKHIGEAVTSVDILNQSTALALEALMYKIKTAVLGRQYG